MDINQFFNLFLTEIQQAHNLQGYYRFLKSPGRFEFRKAYFMQRLQYIYDHIDSKDAVIWDCGCGYGTTGIFLAMNGIRSFGSTLEYYYKDIPQRKKYWEQFGDTNLFTANYENMFDNPPPENSVDIILLQDTIHHLEPFQEALAIFKKVLKPNGTIILIEENGNNIMQRFKLYLRRRNNMVITMWDEKLNKNIIIGNENIRSLKEWRNEFSKQNFKLLDNETRYIRIFPPFLLNSTNAERIISKEQKIWRKNTLLREYFFFGINFIMNKI